MTASGPVGYRLASAGVLGLVMLLAIAAIAITNHFSSDRIKRQQQLAKLSVLTQLLPLPHDNDMAQDTLALQTEKFFRQSQNFVVYRARQQDEPVGLVMMPLVVNGYNGPIRLAVGIDYQDRITAVRILEHHETPGLGAGIDQARSDWIRQFTGRSLTKPAGPDWALRREGGRFDGLSGATVSPRAVVNTVRQALRFYRAHKQQLYAASQ